MILGGVGFMIGTGGCALVAKTLGEGNQKKANQYFTMMVKLALYSGVVLSVIGILFMRPISLLLGATEAMLEDCVIYGRTVFVFNTAFYAAECISNLFDSRRETAFRACDYSCRGRYKYGIGRVVCCSF